MSNDSWAMLSIGIKALKAKLVQLREANHKHRHHYSMMYDTLVFTRPLTLYQFELVEMLVKATPMNIWAIDRRAVPVLIACRGRIPNFSRASRAASEYISVSAVFWTAAFFWPLIAPVPSAINTTIQGSNVIVFPLASRI